MSLEVRILVGTMTGTAEMVAQEVQQSLQNSGHSAAYDLMDSLTAAVLQPGPVYLICTSTYGNGDVPDNAQAFYNSLQQERPKLAGIRYGVIALGDHTYKNTFCQGGIIFDKLLTELGAQRVGAILMCDASSGDLPEEKAAEWAGPWAEGAESSK